MPIEKLYPNPVLRPNINSPQDRYEQESHELTFETFLSDYVLKILTAGRKRKKREEIKGMPGSEETTEKLLFLPFLSYQRFLVPIPISRNP
jgi:hypothetical protein